MRVAGVFLQDLWTDHRLDPDPEEPLGIEYVLASAKAKGHTVRLFTVLDAPVEDLWQEILKFEPDVVGFSVFTTHAPRTLETARRLKQRKPGILTVAGGPHPSAVPDFVLSPSIDVCVLGEGEITFCELLDTFERGGPLHGVPGVAVASRERVVFGPPRVRNDNLDALPLPLREKRYYAQPAYSISYPPAKEINWRPMLFSRGCTMPCRFCSSRDLWGNQVRFRSPKGVVEELRILRDDDGVNWVFFEDLTFTLNPRRFLELCDALKKAGLGIHWACETHVNTVTEDLILAMKSAGCVKILWGIENLSDSSLQRLRKRQTHRDIKRSLGLAAKHGILTWGCFIIGFPWETEKEILALREDLSRIDVHQLRVSIATPLPGSDWHKEMPASALNPDLSLYDTNHLVYDHPTISPRRMKELQREVFTSFYQSTAYRDRVARMCHEFPHLRESFDEFLSFIDSDVILLDEGLRDISQPYSFAYSSDERRSLSPSADGNSFADGSDGAVGVGGLKGTHSAAV